jgi:hypothetical protein
VSVIAEQQDRPLIIHQLGKSTDHRIEKTIKFFDDILVRILSRAGGVLWVAITPQKMLDPVGR